LIFFVFPLLSFSDKINKELKTTKKSKDAHGFGTKIIAKIAADYHGMVDYFEDFNMFGVQVILPDSPEHKNL
jgi:hypothetical protein